MGRFSQVNPKILFAVEAVMYNGKKHDQLEKLQKVVNGKVKWTDRTRKHWSLIGWLPVTWPNSPGKVRFEIGISARKLIPVDFGQFEYADHDYKLLVNFFEGESGLIGQLRPIKANKSNVSKI